jgi:hypothetical protein
MNFKKSIVHHRDTEVTELFGAFAATQGKVTRKNKPPQIHRLNLFIISESVATFARGIFCELPKEMSLIRLYPGFRFHFSISVTSVPLW